MMKVPFWYTHALLMVLGVLTLAPSAHAQTVPPSADVGRVQENLDLPLIPLPEGKIQELPNLQPRAQPPANAHAIRFTIQSVTVEGATAFDDVTLSALYGQFIGEEVSLNMVWNIARDITDLYHQKGYFLSRAYVPEQEIASGHVRLQVVEGFIGRVEMPDHLKTNRLVTRETDKITQKIPLRRQDLESLLLNLNDLPGVLFDALLKPEDAGNYGVPSGQVVLVLDAQETGPHAQASLDNYGSEFLGPGQLSLGLQTALIPYHETSFSMARGVPEDELKSFALSHKIPLTSRTKLSLNGSVTQTEPGASLAANNVLGDSVAYGVRLEHSLVRQRAKNLALHAGFEVRDSETDLLSNPLVRDRTSVLTAGLRADTFDDTGALNQGTFTVSKGLDVLGANEQGDANLSRVGADPQHLKFNASYLRQQPLPHNFLVQFQVEGQYSNDSLVSSEEFGFGGPRLGRAFDASEISGDRGFGAGLELHYLGWGAQSALRKIPYAFYDIGRVWNEEAGRPAETASSAGIGLRLMHENRHKTRFYADFYAAQPIIKSQSNPLIGEGKAPRVGVRLGVLK